MKKLRITVGEKVYEVSVEILDEGAKPSAPAAPAPAALSSAPVSVPAPAASAPKPAAPVSAGAGDVVSPLSGKVVAVDVKPGAQVNEGDQVLTIEAMKMNTYVYASASGKVAAVMVSPGEGVEEGQLLVRIE